MKDTDILIEKIERLTERCNAFQERNDHLWSRIGKLEAALREIADAPPIPPFYKQIASAALAPETAK